MSVQVDRRTVRRTNGPQIVETSQFLELIDRLSALPLALVAIDGHSAAGKSSLARAAQTARPDCVVVHTDDFYRPLDPRYRASLDAAGGYEEYYDWQRLRSDVLHPLRAGLPARFQTYDWLENRLDRWTEIAPVGLIIVEGCYSARPELRSCYDASVYVDASSAARARRQKHRNDADLAWLDRWDAAERHYLERYFPPESADLIVRGD
jgi:uridine kinase